jgi:hypothetical protein
MADNHAQADADILAEAIKDGRIDARYAPVWLDSLQADREGTKRVLAAIHRPAPSAGSTHNRIARNDVYVPEVAPVPKLSGSVTPEAMNSQANSDPALQRTAWMLGVRDGIEPPPEQFYGFSLGDDD